MVQYMCIVKEYLRKSCLLSSTGEAELAELFHNGKEVKPMPYAIFLLNLATHSHPSLFSATHNTTASGVANDNAC